MHSFVFCFVDFKFALHLDLDLLVTSLLNSMEQYSCQSNREASTMTTSFSIGNSIHNRTNYSYYLLNQIIN